MIRTLIPFFSLIIAISVVMFFVRPMYEGIKMTQAEADGYSQAVEKASEYNNLLATLISDRNSLGARELERLEALVPDDLDEIKLIIDMDALARKHNLLLRGIGVQFDSVAAAEAPPAPRAVKRGPITEEDFDERRIDFSVVGTYDQIRTFIADIERSLVLLDVTSLGFTVTEGDLQEFNFSVVTYAYKQ